jgi:hypothetical protein
MTRGKVGVGCGANCDGLCSGRDWSAFCHPHDLGGAGTVERRARGLLGIIEGKGARRRSRRDHGLFAGPSPFAALGASSAPRAAAGPSEAHGNLRQIRTCRTHQGNQERYAVRSDVNVIAAMRRALRASMNATGLPAMASSTIICAAPHLGISAWDSDDRKNCFFMGLELHDKREVEVFSKSMNALTGKWPLKRATHTTRRSISSRIVRRCS